MIIRVKLPKSFLAVNLSESHTFHKKEESEEGEKSLGEREKKGVDGDQDDETDTAG